jgi:hypothetical protein
VTWPHGNCPTACWTIGSGQAAANPHVEQVGPGQAFHLRKLRPEVLGQPADDPAPPAFRLLALQDGPADGPVQPDQLRVDRPQCPGACGPDPVLEFTEELGVAGGKGEATRFGQWVPF